MSELKSTNPGRYYEMARKIGGTNDSHLGEIRVESLSEFSNKESAQKIADHFASISNEFLPINSETLPAFLPAQMPPQVEEYQVYSRLLKIKKSKSTLPLDLPDELRKECAAHLAAPLTLILNSCLNHSIYPTLWKQEWVTPVPKITHPKDISDLRKISCTSDFSKTFEGFLKDWILEDISTKLDMGQFGGQKGLGTEHMLVCFIDRILKLLDSHPDKSAVIATSLDWAAAFDRQDPTLAVLKLIEMGVRPSLIPLLISYLSERKMQVKFNGEMSDFLILIGGGPQGTLLGLLEYLIQSNDNAESVHPEDRFKYIDDLSILHLILFSGLLVEYDIMKQVPSDIGVDHAFLPTKEFATQDCIDEISSWTTDNLMKLKEQKCNYMIFSRSSTEFTTRLHINDHLLERVSSFKLLGVQISEDLSWDKNCQEICRKAYSRISLLTKLKYAGVSIEDLIEIYILFIRSIAEYC